ncbi:hypothetical protein [Bacteroides sp. 519]|uniref:hypothetical protein n=1 Tax=Bacteroides sp. 519 TaxID=2302937 RepID=UPI0013D6BE36|nr:hypothetical protein [Bacteroides sp. 519]NDV58912.1 hypothetical protein [Bacteroides sp. 519]
MKKRDKNCVRVSVNEPKRQQKMTCLLTEEELRIIERYLEKYKISNRSRWMRETLLASVMRKMEEDYPTLFNEHDMRR